MMNGSPKATLPETALRPKGPAAIMAALNQIRPNQIVVYHRGMLGKDRKGFSSASQDIDRIADRAMRLANRNLATLTQFREAPDIFLYVATGMNDFRPATNQYGR